MTLTACLEQAMTHSSTTKPLPGNLAHTIQAMPIRVVVCFLLLALLPWASAQDRSHARSMVITRQGIVSTSHTLASQAGAEILARGVAEVFARADVLLGLCFQHRTRAAARALKNRLGTGALGYVVHVEMRVPWWRDQAYYDEPGRGTLERDGGGVLISQAIHTLDLMLDPEEYIDATQIAPTLEYVKKWPAEHWPLAFCSLEHSSSSGMLCSGPICHSWSWPGPLVGWG